MQEILTFDAPDGSRRGVLLRGPSRADMLALFNELRSQGGVPAGYMQPMELRIRESAPPLSGGSLPDAALIQRIVIEGGRAVVVEAFGPGADIIFAMSASDRSGKIGVSRARVSEHLPASR